MLAEWIQTLGRIGMGTAEPISASYEPGSFGNGEAVFRFDTLMLRLVRERSQEFVDIASQAAPTMWFPFEDVCIAFGWRDLAEVLASPGSTPLEKSLGKLLQEKGVLETALSACNFSTTAERVRLAGDVREKAFLDKLRRLADHNSGNPKGS